MALAVLQTRYLYSVQSLSEGDCEQLGDNGAIFATWTNQHIRLVYLRMDNDLSFKVSVTIEPFKKLLSFAN
jgi:hypothetical protein